MSADFVNLATKFYNLLNRTNNSIALSTTWVVFFDFPAIFGPQGSNTGGYSVTNQVADIKLRDVIKPVFGGGNSWDGIEAGRSSVKFPLHGGAVLYASKVTVPGDSYGATRYGDYQMGWQKGFIGSGRRDFMPLTIDFYETQASITDFVIRPWAVMVGHNSLKISTVKTVIHVVPLFKNVGAKTNIPRKVFSFHNCWPEMIGPEDYSHAPENVISRSVNFQYDYYSVTNVRPGAHDVSNPAYSSLDSTNYINIINVDSDRVNVNV